MEIMLTVQPWNDLGRALEIIKKLKLMQVRKARVNLKTLYQPKHLDELFAFLYKANKINEEIEWHFDIGLPGDTLRIVIPNSPYCISVNSGEKIRVYFDNNDNFENGKDIYIRKTLDSTVSAHSFRIGDTFLYGDGEIEFKISDANNTFFEAIAENKGELWDGKAIYPNHTIITQYDSLSYLLQYINSMPQKESNYLICSLVEDLESIISIKSTSDIKVISKLETKLGIENIESISSVSDGIMMGRGDLFLDARNYLQYWELQQKFLEHISKNKTLYSLIATGIVDSLKNNKIPTRGDITDLFYLMKYRPQVLCLSSNLFYSNNLNTCISILQKIDSYYK